MAATFRFARGDGFDALAECRAWRARDAQGLDEMAKLMGHLALVNDHGKARAAPDEWSPPDLYLFRSGRASGVYAVKPATRRTAQTMLLIVCDLGAAPNADKCEREARRRLAATGFLEA